MTTRVFAERYELQELLGQGGMGEVWTARDAALGGRLVAVKILPGERIASLAGSNGPEELRRRFLRECRVTARIDHPGLVTVYDAGSEGGTLYLVIQLVEGSNLADHLAEQHPDPYPWHWAAAVLAQLSSALVAVHAAGVVHRDLKPGNVMIRPDGRLTILDLGVAAARGESEDTRLTRTGMLVGTPLYMAPEQAVGGTPVGPAADLYALGVLGYELLAGRPPLTAPDATGLLYKKLHEQPVQLAALRPDVPATLAALPHRLMASDPEDRLAGAHQVYAEVAPFLHGTGQLGSRGKAGGPMDPTRPFTHPMAPWPPARPGPERQGDTAVAGMVDEIRAHLRAGHTEMAAQLLHRVLPLASARYGSDSTVVRTLRKQYAAALVDIRAYAQALPEIQALLRLFHTELSPYDPVVVQLREDERLCLHALGRP